MKRKIILATTITSIVLALTVFCFGVYASMTQEFSISNTIGFVSSKNVYLSFMGEVQDCVQVERGVAPDGYNTMDEYKLDKGFVYEQLFDEADRGNSDYPSTFTWTIKEPAQFVSANTPIIYRVEIWNYSEVKVSIKLNFQQNNDKISNSASCRVIGENTTGTDEIVLNEYIEGQQPSKAEFILTTRVKFGSISSFTETNNFNFVSTAV